MVCEKCGTEIKQGIKFCTKCGSKIGSQKEKLNMLSIPSIILIVIGIIVHISLRFFGLSGEIMGRFNWWSVSYFTLGGGVILALISLYKVKNKITLIIGIIAGAYYPFMILLSIMGFYD